MFGTSDDASVDEAAAERRRDKPPAKAAEGAPEAHAGRRKRKERKERKRPRIGSEAEEPASVRPKAETKPRSEPPRRDDGDDGDARHDSDPAEARLYVSVGRKDGVRVGDLNRLFQDTAGLSREEVGRIRLRDKHSFVSVPAAKVEAVVEALHGIDFHDRELKVEPARAG